MDNSVTIRMPEISEREPQLAVSKQKMNGCCPIFIESCLIRRAKNRKVMGISIGYERRRLIHAAKVGLALVLVSLLYMLEAVHDRLGDNAMWAVMTVVVIFDITAGATISKGINRGVGTILGGGLGFLVAFLAQWIGGAGKVVAIAISVSLFCGAATYIRMIPNIKKKYDYGAMIFILTFSLVAISGVRGDQIIKIASDRLSSIFIGSAICIFISLFIFPEWCGDELHNSLATKFDDLACSIQEILEEYIDKPKASGAQIAPTHKKCLAVLASKANEESMANFAKWEPWHGKFGFDHPWNKYLQIGELLRELAGSIIAIGTCLRFETRVNTILHHPNSQCIKMDTKDRYEMAFSLLVLAMRELEDRIYHSRWCQQGESAFSKLQTTRTEFCSHMNQNDAIRGNFPNSFFVLGEIVDKVEEIVKEVDGLGQASCFRDLPTP